jgi:uncharacterized membrane protein YcaP (DUF421 family)
MVVPAFLPPIASDVSDRCFGNHPLRFGLPCDGGGMTKSMSASINWHSVFVPGIGLAEVVVRGSIMYLCMFAILRFVGRRQAGHFGPADLLVIVMIADAAQNGLGKDYSSVTEGVILVLTIVSWEYFLDWVSFRFPVLRPVLKAPSLKLIQDGHLEKKNLRREMLTEEELKSQLRELEVEDYNEVRLCTLEGDGRLSVLKKKVASN